MAIGFIEAVTMLFSTCTRRMSRAARSLGIPKKKKTGLMKIDRQIDNETLNGQDVVWKKSILMGEKCQPLNFSGVIYYDADGNKLDNVPPRSPMRSPLRTLGQHVTMLPAVN